VVLRTLTTYIYHLGSLKIAVLPILSEKKIVIKTTTCAFGSSRRAKAANEPTKRVARGADLDKGFDGPFGDVQERRPATHVGPLTHGGRGVDEEHYDSHALGAAGLHNGIQRRQK
jgi:hypothetical protein